MENSFNKGKMDHDSFESMIGSVRDIRDKSLGSSNNWDVFFLHCSNLILQSIEVEKYNLQQYLKDNTFDYLKLLNYQQHQEKMKDHYNNSYANPKFSVKCFGEKIGQLNSLLFTKILQLNKIVHERIKIHVEETIQLFTNYYSTYSTMSADFDVLLNVIKNYYTSTMYTTLYSSIVKRFSTSFDHYTNWVKNADLSDLRYLYYYGNYVSEDDLTTAKFLNSLSESKVKKVMEITAKAYIEGFAEGNKDYTKKETVLLIFHMGMERLARYLIFELENTYNLKVCVADVLSGKFEQQYLYDHRFATSLFLNEDFIEEQIKTTKQCYVNLSELMKAGSGRIYIDSFGDIPFSPENKTECLKFNQKQIELNKELNAINSMNFSKYSNKEETSYCIVAFPSPVIGEFYEEIFDKTIEINSLDHNNWLHLQQIIIDILDQSEAVQVVGEGKNRTNITIQMNKLHDPLKESNFLNCGATQNIPVGEIFTSPKLEGTNGLLHLQEIYLRDLYYKDLKIEFTNGRISSYTCENYNNEDDNKRYIEENLLFPHKSLPMGEFAIGTNTLAYSMAKKYDIMSRLPILIIEKMGPHFAIGDTCFSREEEIPIYNPDGKEVVARDNEQSILRKNDPLKAYTQVHIDITLPYHEIRHLTAVLKHNEKINIIYNGRFVLKGIESLNQYLEM